MPVSGPASRADCSEKRRKVRSRAEPSEQLVVGRGERSVGSMSGDQVSTGSVVFPDVPDLFSLISSITRGVGSPESGPWIPHAAVGSRSGTRSR